ncbi:NAD-glutamate dehydrogenase [Ketobacter sp.]|uniref:NAD-glutamate dehydrogenase n=1 Tax=Ketobacter sp. TaxID=2083498 RepID=UPI000F1AB8E5|nr:NAD-glutamate dehydrogenase [Ketobacter sp.]RLT93507.1 MAG: NAD-glutamate dehydrogenase [Ketobacter sp.]
MVNLSLGEDYLSLIERLSDMVQERFDRSHSSQTHQVLEFARHFYSAAPIQELQRKRIDDLYGMTVGLWSFLRVLPDRHPRIRVFNPRYEDHGWQSTHTVVEVLAPDCAFLVDTVMMDVVRRGISIHSVMNSVFRTQRNADGDLDGLSFDMNSEGAKEALIHLEIDRQPDAALVGDITNILQETLEELYGAVEDFETMQARTSVIRDEIQELQDNRGEASLLEVKAFLAWLVQNHFTFLAMQEYKVVEKQGESYLQAVEGSAHGVAKVCNSLDLLEQDGGPLIHQDKLIVFGKSGTRSRWHRPVYMDFIGIRKCDERGKVVGEYRWLGLYTSLVFNNSPRNFPIIGHKLRKVISGSGLEPHGHDGKRLMQILETFPREELFQTSTEALLKTAVGILHIQERRRLRLFVRKGQFGRFLSCLIYTPRDGYSTALRKSFQSVLYEYVDVEDMEFNTYFTESTLARLYIVLKVKAGSKMDFDVKEVETRLIELARSWSDRLYETLIESVGEDRAGMLQAAYADAFSLSYREEFSTRTAVSDIEHIEQLNADNPLAVSFYHSLEDDPRALRFKLFRRERNIPLSDVLPMLEHLGLRVLGGRPYRIKKKDESTIWVYDFNVRYFGDAVIEIEKVKHKFQEAFLSTWRGFAEDDSFNRLVLSVGLSWRQVAMLRAYARYFKQTGFAFSQTYIKDALVNHPQVTRLLAEFFELRFALDQPTSDAAEAELRATILEQLDQVASLDEDRILRRYLDMMTGTLRTNFYQQDHNGEYKPYISFKLAPKTIPELPRPLPMFEIFVYSPRVEGVHLRGGKVARGGLRWSDRREDFRTEVLGLVKAQQVKNAVIVPVGAKGGFYPKRLPKSGSRDAVMSEGIECYKTFIRGLLDITDNLQNGEVVPPQNVIRKDEDDPYLVVAADKGTATFSDIANSLSEEYGFWLGDAFASGGSVGYDHKKMGITARGAWVSVQRHFRELGIDVQTNPVTLIGIGDMSGDVFGNGLLRSRTLQMVAAFNHLHIFIDPNPDPEASYQERERLFNLPRSNWSDYNSELISAGGGVFSRAAKSIRISAQMKERFDIHADALTPTELISALLKAPVDLIWNGGIGTYIKSSQEMNSEVGDKANDGLRVNGRDVRAKVIGEGGNLGITQLGRIEYSLNGGLSNTDFIDNAGGVDCSDHEVNIKILLNDIVHDGDMTVKQRNELLAQMTEEVAELVLKNNYRQTQALSVARSETIYRMGEYKRYIHALVAEGKLDRELEYIPTEEEIHERVVNGKGLTRPELSTLLSYTKAILKDQLTHSTLPDDDYICHEIERAFPKVLVERYRDPLYAHKLRREIVATQVASGMVDFMGITFVHRMKDAAGASVPDIARAFIASRDVFDLENWWQQIEALDYKIDAAEQIEMMRMLIRLMRRATRWFLRNNRCGVNVQDAINRFRQGVQAVADSLPVVLSGPRREVWEERHNRYVEKGVPSTLATFIAGADSMLPVLGIIQAAEVTGKPVPEVAEVYFALGSQLDLYWFNEEINALNIENHWQALAREAYRDDLDWQQRTLTVGVLQMGGKAHSVEERVNAWAQHHETMIARWKALIAEFHGMDVKEFSMYGVALRELMDLAQTTLHSETSSAPDC